MLCLPTFTSFLRLMLVNIPDMDPMVKENMENCSPPPPKKKSSLQFSSPGFPNKMTTTQKSSLQPCLPPF